MAHCPYYGGAKLIGKKYEFRCMERFIVFVGIENQQEYNVRISMCEEGEGRENCRPFLFNQLEENGFTPTSEWGNEQLHETYIKEIKKQEVKTMSAEMGLTQAAANADYEKAVELHRQIMMNGNIAASALVEMCKLLKQMRDERLYIQLEFDSFETYVEQAVGIKKRQAYTYISAYENLGITALQANAHLGITKLELLTSVSVVDRDDFIENNDLENMSTREMKELVEQLRVKGEQLTLITEERDKALEELTQLQDDNGLVDINSDIARLEVEKEEIENKYKELQKQLTEKETAEFDEAEIERIRQEAAEEAKEQLQAEIDKAVKAERTQADREKEAVKKEGAREAEEKLKASLTAVEIEKTRAIERAQILEKKLSLSGNPETVLFSHLFEEFNSTFNKLLGCIKKLEAEDPDNAEKFRGAIRKYIGMMDEKL